MNKFKIADRSLGLVFQVIIYEYQRDKFFWMNLPYKITWSLTMHVTLVYVDIIADKVDAFIEATRLNHLNSINEPGNRRFDVLRDSENPNRFLLYEAYASEADAKAHKETDHYFEWRDRVQSMMASPRRGVRYDGLFPEA